MKITLFVLTIFVFRISTAQELSISVSSGYNHKIAGGHFSNYDYDYFVGAFYSHTNDYKTFSLGQGMNYNFGIVYQTKRKIGFQIDGSYLHGIKNKSKSQIDETSNFYKEIYSRFFRVIPKAYIATEYKKTNVQFNIGMVITSGEFFITQQLVSSSYEGFKYVNRFYGGVSFGISTGIKANYLINKRMSLFLDLNLISSTYSPLKRKTVEIDDYKMDYTTSYYETEYVEHTDYFQQNNLNEPSKQVKINLPNSSIGLQIGVNFQLWKKTDKNDQLKIEN